MITTIISAIYGDKDDIPPRPPVPENVECILVTDSDLDTPGWTKVHLPSNLHPRLAAKHPKCKPWQYTDAPTVLWMDASCRFLSEDTYPWLNWHADTMVNKDCHLSMIKHPWRSDVLDEAHASVGMPKYDGLPVVEQAEHYIAMGHPRYWGLWASGLMIVDLSGVMNREHVKVFGEAWYDQNYNWTYQDQISQPVCIRENNINVHELDTPLHGGSYVQWLNHKSQL